MQFQSKKNNLLFILSLLLMMSFPVCAVKQESSIDIQQINGERIAKYAQEIKCSMQYKNILRKSTLGALGCYMTYSLVNWFRNTGAGANGVPNKPDITTEEGRMAELRSLRGDVDQLRTAHELQNNSTGLEKTLKLLKGSGSVAFQWIVLPIMLNVGSHKVQEYIGSTESINAFDSHTTHCEESLRYIVYTIEEVAQLISQARCEGNIDIKKDFITVFNRLLISVEKMIGFMRAKGSMFRKNLQDEANILVKKMTKYTQEFAEDLQNEFQVARIDYLRIAKIVASFGKRYTQEKQRFALIEQESR